MVEQSVIQMLRDTPNQSVCEDLCMGMYRHELVDIAQQICAPVRSTDRKDEIATTIAHCLGKTNF